MVGQQRDQFSLRDVEDLAAMPLAADEYGVAAPCQVADGARRILREGAEILGGIDIALLVAGGVQRGVE